SGRFGAVSAPGCRWPRMVLTYGTLATAGATTVAQFRTRMRKLREKRAPESMVARVREAREQRERTLDPLSNGMAYLTLYTGWWRRPRCMTEPPPPRPPAPPPTATRAP